MAMRIARAAPSAEGSVTWPAFEQQHGGSIGEDETLAVGAERAACALEAHAETTAYDTPRAANFVDTALVAALYIDRAIDAGATRGRFSP
jgi:hypothetical protein